MEKTIEQRLEKIRIEYGYSGKPKQWQEGFDCALKELVDWWGIGRPHDCEKWREEGMGCAICTHAGRMTVEEIKEAQDWSNWYVTDLKRQVEELQEQLKKRDA